MRWKPEERRKGLRGDPYEPPFQRCSVEERERLFQLADEYRSQLITKAKDDRENSRLRKSDLETLVVMLASHGPLTNRELARLCGYKDLTKFRISRINPQCHLGLIRGFWLPVGNQGVIVYEATSLGRQLVGLEAEEAGDDPS